MHLRLNRIQYPVHNLGPGNRIAIWLQGCTLCCKDCISPSLWNPNKGKDVNVRDLVQQILLIKDDFDGITLTGGEPMQQYEAVMCFCALIKRLTDLNIYVFSGYTLEELERLYPDKVFIHYIDYLMDGRYENEIHDDANVRGSANQKLYHFNGRDAEEIEPKSYGNKWSFYLSADGRLFLSGIPRKKELDRLKNHIKLTGIDLEFV